jgi:hypothetical protein
MKIKEGFLWVTLGFFAITLSVHWIYAWFAYIQDERSIISQSNLEIM